MAFPLPAFRIADCIQLIVVATLITKGLASASTLDVSEWTEARSAALEAVYDAHDPVTVREVVRLWERASECAQTDAQRAECATRRFFALYAADLVGQDGHDVRTEVTELLQATRGVDSWHKKGIVWYCQVHFSDHRLPEPPAPPIEAVAAELRAIAERGDDHAAAIRSFEFRAIASALDGRPQDCLAIMEDAAQHLARKVRVDRNATHTAATALRNAVSSLGWMLEVSNEVDGPSLVTLQAGLDCCDRIDERLLTLVSPPFTAYAREHLVELICQQVSSHGDRPRPTPAR